MENIITHLENTVNCYFEGGNTELYGYEFEFIRDAIPCLKKYAEIKAKVDEYKEKTKDRPVENHLELMVRLKELETHQLCLANQILEIFAEDN